MKKQYATGGPHPNVAWEKNQREGAVHGLRKLRFAAWLALLAGAASLLACRDSKSANWNAAAITAEPKAAAQAYTQDAAGHIQSAGVVLSFVLRSHHDRAVTIPQTLRLELRGKRGNLMPLPAAHLLEDTALPAGQSAVLRVALDISCEDAAGKDPYGCIERAFEGANALVLFDPATRFAVELPIAATAVEAALPLPKRNRVR